MTDSSSGVRRRSLREDLLADLQQGTSRIPAAGPAAQPGSPLGKTAETTTVELRITPRLWSPAGWTALPEGNGFVVSVGPVRLSLGLRRN